MEIIKLNLIPSGVNPVCHCSQYDNGRVIRAELFDGLTPYALASGDVVTLNVRKPDNTIVTGTITTTQGNNYVDIITTEQICACVGETLCELKITNGSTVIGTLNFILLVERDVIADGIDSESVIENIETLVYSAVNNLVSKQLDPNENTVIDGQGYINIIDYTNYIEKKYYTITGVLASYNAIIGSTKAIKIPDGVKVLHVVIDTVKTNNSVLTFWSSKTANSTTFISGVNIPSKTQADTFVILVPENAKYLRIPFYDYNLKILVSQYVLTGIDGDKLENTVIASMQHYERANPSGTITATQSVMMSDIFNVDSTVLCIADGDFDVGAVNLSVDPVSVINYAKVVELEANNNYRLLFKKHNDDTYRILQSDLFNLHIKYGGKTANGVTNLATINKEGVYFIPRLSVLNINDMPLDFPRNASAILEVKKYFATSNTTPYFIQTLKSINPQSLAWFRYTVNGLAYNNWCGGSSLSGKKVSIFGDSISTFVGWIPEGNATWYNGNNGGVSNVYDTWWKKVIDALGLDLVVNNSWSGRAVSSIRDGQSAHATDAGYKEANILQLKDGSILPEIIIIKLGINDFNNGALLGDYDGSTALPTDPTKFLDAYAIMLNLIMTNFPLAEVYCCTLMSCEISGDIGFPEINSNGDTLGKWNEAIVRLAHAFGAKVLNHDVCGITYYNLSSYMGDYSGSTSRGLHPNAAGMSLIANQTINEMDNATRLRY